MVFKESDHRKSGQIKITHYVSPHEFWFKYLDDTDNGRYREINERIQRLGNVSTKYQNHAPSIGDIVIVQCCFGASYKYVRARVDYELQYSSGNEYILWAIDEGFPIRSSIKWITRLSSEDLKTDSGCVFKGTLNGVVPASLQFDYLELKSVMTKTLVWSEKAINEFEKVSNAESLIFHYDCHAAEQHIYGSLEVKTFTGKSVNMDDLLKNLEEAVDATNFEKEYQKLVRKDYWVQEQENYKIRANINGALPQTNVNSLNPRNIHEINTVDKINDWDKRNQQSLSPMSLGQRVQECHLDEMPLNKRYQYCTQLNAPQPSTSKGWTNKPERLSKVSTSSVTESSTDSFYSAVDSYVSHDDESVKVLVPKDQFKKALRNETFSTRHQDRVLMHCRDGVMARSISSIAEANFKDEIHESLKKMSIVQLYRIQAVGWPHLMRGHSMIVINAAKTGKTWTYLPAVCSLLMEAHSDEKIVQSEGPVMIILCLDSASVKKVHKNCESLLSTTTYSLEAFTQYDTESIQYKLLNGIDILITTVPCLLRLMKNPMGLLNKKRITTIVFDEIDTMSDRYGENDIQTIYKMFCDSEGVQAIVTSKTWHKTLKKFWVKEDLLLCIGAYIEAAIYCNADITVRWTNDDQRFQDFLSYFKQRNYTEEQTIIVCSKSDEVFAIEKYFQSEGYSNITYCHDKTDSEKIASINALNHTDACGVLVCTDDVLGDLWIRNAQHIIHFSLPDYWTAFTQRFIASFDYYDNMIGVDKSSAGRPTSVILVDKYSCDTLPRLVEFMGTRCHAKIPKCILDLAEAKRMEREERLTDKKMFCENMLLLGVCHNEYSCKFRHILTKVDRPDEFVPTSGRIKFEILAVRSPAHFSVRLLEHYSMERNEWQKMPHVDDYFSFRRKFDRYFNQEDNHQIHHPAKVGDLCVMDVCEDGTGQFERCEVIGLEINKQISLMVIDSNKAVPCLKPNELLVLPEQFKEFPRQAVDVRIAGVVPLDLSTNWDDNAKLVVQQWIKSGKKCQIQGTIEFALMKCVIWVKTIEIVEELKSIGGIVTQFNFKKEIIRQDLGVADNTALQRLRNMAEKAGIFDTKPLTPERTREDNQKRGRGRGRVLSHSSSESVSSATSLPRVRLTDVVRDKSFHNPTLGDLPEKSKSNCQRSIAPKMENRLPVKRWATLIPDTFNEVDLGEYYSPERFYVLLGSEFSRFKTLKRKIYKFTRVSSNLKPLVDVEVGQICLAAAEKTTDDGEDYRRAQITKVNQTTVSIFLVDFGVEEYGVPTNDLIEIPETFINCLPFQAILCKMTGVRPVNNSEHWQDPSCGEIYHILDKCLFLQPIGRPSVSNDIMQCNSYDAVIADKEQEQIVNELVVQQELAEFDTETKHLIDVTVDWDTLQFADSMDDNDSDDSEWDSEEENRNNFAADCSSNGFIKDMARFPFGNSWDDETMKDYDIQVDDEQLQKWVCQLKNMNLIVDANPPSTPAICSTSNAEAEMEEKSALIRKTTTEHIESIKMSSKLIHPAKQPYIEWTQTDTMVKMAIQAPDVKDYSLTVGSRYVKFCFDVNKERFENLLNLYGCVNAKFTTHEVRGLNIIVRLQKTLVGMRWPRLEQSPDKNRFIKAIVDDSGDSDEIGNDYLPSRRKDNGSSTSSDEMNDDDDAILSDFDS